MKENYFLIGEVTKITGISKDTLHFYDKKDILKPSYIDNNNYRYYSVEDLWRLDIITMCRKLDIPLKQIKEILQLKDNDKIVQILMNYYDKAIELSQYYQSVANDILWYSKENNLDKQAIDITSVNKVYFEETKVIISNDHYHSYHASLQEASQPYIKQLNSIKRKYGYILNIHDIYENKFIKEKEYLMIDNDIYNYIVPSGEYAVCHVHIHNEYCDFHYLIDWLNENNYDIDYIYAQELGLHLFEYLDDYYCMIKAHLVKKS